VCGTLSTLSEDLLWLEHIQERLKSAKRRQNQIFPRHIGSRDLPAVRRREIAASEEVRTVVNHTFRKSRARACNRNRAIAALRIFAEAERLIGGNDTTHCEGRQYRELAR